MISDKFNHNNLCESCKNTACCTSCNSPILLPSDIKKISESVSVQNFYEKNLENNSEKYVLKKNPSNECIFWDNKKNKCSIYSKRPFDCKMFPFDIIKFNNDYYWIVFSCNSLSDWSWTEEHLSDLESDPNFYELIEILETYSSYSLSSLNGSEPQYVILRPVKIPIEIFLKTPLKIQKNLSYRNY